MNLSKNKHILERKTIKMKKTIKTFALLFAFLTIVVSAACVTSFAAEEETRDVTIIKNIAVSDKIQGMYAIPVADGITEDNTVLNVYDKNPAEEGAAVVWSGKGTKTAIQQFDGREFIVFYTNRVALYEIANVYYIQAEIDGVKSQVESYSVAEYLFERLYKDDFVNKASSDSTDYSRKLFYEGLVKTGAGAHKAITNDAPKSIEDYVYVYVKEGTLANGSSSAMLNKGEKVTLIHSNSATKWDVVSYDINNTAAYSSTTESTFTLTSSTVFAAPDPYVYTFDEGFGDTADAAPFMFASNYNSGSTGGNNQIKFDGGAMHFVTTDQKQALRVSNPMCETKPGATKFVMEGDFTFNILDADSHAAGGLVYYDMHVGNSPLASANIPNRLIFYVEGGSYNYVRIGNSRNYIVGGLGEKLHIRYEITAGDASTSTPCNYKVIVNGVEVYNGNSHSGSYTAGISSFGNYYAFEFIPKGGTPNCEIVIDNLKFSKE